MSEKDIKELMELAQSLKANVNTEDAFRSFITAGILDTEGNYTGPYKELEVTI